MSCHILLTFFHPPNILCKNESKELIMSSLFSSDLEKLNSLYNRITFSFLFLYGRADTGKTSLIRDFCKGKRTLYFSAQDTVPQRQLHAFWRETIRVLKPRSLPPVFTDWNQAFAYISDYSFAHRLILVLDEFHLLTQHSPEFMDAFQKAVSHSFPSGKVFLIAATSSVGYAQEQMQAPAAAPFDAVTARACLSPIPFFTCQPLLSQYEPREQLLLYGITGGLPSHIKKLRPMPAARDNVLALFFRSDSPLLSNPLNILHRELREISTYNFLLEIMAEGNTKLADIAAKAEIGTNKCAKYLNTLLSLGLIEKEFPAAGEIQKKVRYIFADHMLRFWYRFVYPNISGILLGQGEEIYEQQVQPYLNEYLLPVFETVCSEYLERLAITGQTPFVYRHTGSWWSGGTKKEPLLRIPLVALDTSHTVLGICHYENSPADTKYLDQLLQPLEPFGTLQRYCCIFSASGFTEELKAKAAKAGNAWLIDLEDMM